MADYGTATYSPDKNTYTGLIGKIAKQIIEGETVRSKFGGLFKEDMRTGKDLEVALYKAATGVDYSSTTPPDAPFPQALVRYYKQNKKRTYAVKVDEKDIDESAIDAGRAEKIAQEIAATLYSGAFLEENDTILSMFKEAPVKGAQGVSDPVIVNGGSYAEPADETAAKSLLADIKNFAKVIREGNPEVNAHDLRVNAPRVCMLIPAKDMTGIDVYARMGAYNEGFAAFGVDDVYEYIPDAGETPEIYIFDDRFAQISKVHADSYKEQPVAGCDNVNAFLHRYIQYACCGLFNAVKLTQA